MLLCCIKLEKHEPLLTFSGLPIYSWIIISRIFSLKNLVSVAVNFHATNHIAHGLLFIKHNFFKSDIFFNRTHIYYVFSRIHAFQSPRFLGSMFLRVKVFVCSGFTGSQFLRSRICRVPVQVLEVALWIYMETTLQHRCSFVTF